MGHHLEDPLESQKEHTLAQSFRRNFTDFVKRTVIFIASLPSPLNVKFGFF